MTNDFHHLAAAYALDALDSEERRQFEAHYPTCDVCVSEVDSFRSVAATLAEGVATPPPADLKARVMRQVAETRQIAPIVPDRVVDLAERRRRRASRPVVLAAVAAAIVLIIGFAAFDRNGSGSDAEAVLAAPDAVVTALDGEVGSLRVVWSDQLDQVAIFGNGLAGTGPGLAYELWFVREDGVAPAGLFDVTGTGTVRTVLDVDDIDPNGWGVTIEPDTGSEQPTGEILYIAEL